MPSPPAELVHRLFGSDPVQAPRRLAARWLFLRALGLIFVSAFYSLLRQATGLIGPDGLLPAQEYLEGIRRFAGAWRFWHAPTVFWLKSDSSSLLLVAWIGLIGSVLLVLNFWPRGMILVCLAAYLSFISALQAFSSYQSDGMLLSAGFVSLFFAPPGFRPGWGDRHPPSRASLFLLLLVWFTIYFESGIAKIASGDPEWRNLTAMDDYYQNGPLPTWIGWYAQHLPHWFHAGTAAFTLALELALVWMAVLPRRFRIALFWLIMPLQIGIIITSNYAFLNYLVLALGILLLDDQYLSPFLPRRRRDGATNIADLSKTISPRTNEATQDRRAVAREIFSSSSLWAAAFFQTWVFYVIAAQLVWMMLPQAPLPTSPVSALEPFRIANRYGLFAVMTRGRYEIEFQGSNNGTTWTPYPFRYKPQDPREAPGIYAPYQPRFDWNLWFASLDDWQQNRFVIFAEEKLLTGSPSVLGLFAGNPFASAPPARIRAVVWQYWFSDRPEKRQEGIWWRRELLGLYAPALEREPDGKFVITEIPQPGQPIRR